MRCSLRYRRALAQQPQFMQVLQMLGQGIAQMASGETDPAKQQQATAMLQFIQQQLSGQQQQQQQQQPAPAQ